MPFDAEGRPRFTATSRQPAHDIFRRRMLARLDPPRRSRCGWSFVSRSGRFADDKGAFVGSMIEMRDPFREPVSVSDPDPAWAHQFADAAARITLALSGLAPTVEHIGSTSVPLRSKPIIDIQIAVDEQHRSVAIGELEGLGFSHHGEGNVPGRDYLIRRSARHPAINVHLFNVGNPLLDDNRMVRDYLRANPRAAREYGAVKDKALAQGYDDLASYSNAKGAHVAAIRDAACWAQRGSP